MGAVFFISPLRSHGISIQNLGCNVATKPAATVCVVLLLEIVKARVKLKTLTSTEFTFGLELQCFKG
jgi:hypothetical protein